MLFHYVLRSISNVLLNYFFDFKVYNVFLVTDFIIMFNVLFNKFSMIFNGHDFLRKSRYRRLQVAQRNPIILLGADTSFF